MSGFAKKLAFMALSALFAGIAAETFLYFIDPITPSERRDYFQKRNSWPLSETPKFRGPLMSARIPHPYWSTSLNPALPGANNFGFEDPENFPHIRREKEVVIGLLGGSVAAFARKPLQKGFEKLRGRYLSCDLNIRVLGLGIGGNKQPSQFHIYSYFIEDIDLAINLDGYNDAVYEGHPMFPTAYPLDMSYLYGMTHEKYLKLLEASTYGRYQYKIVIAATAHDWILRSRLVFFFLKELYIFFENWKNTILQNINSFDRPMISPRSLQEQAAERIAVWEKYVRLQYQLAVATGKKTYFFLQPSRYADPNVKFSREEIDLFMAKEPTLMNRSIEGYQRIQRSAHTLSSEGLPMEDISRLFAKIEAPRFIDECHLNDIGNEEMAHVIASKILPEIDKAFCHKKRISP